MLCIVLFVSILVSFTSGDNGDDSNTVSMSLETLEMLMQYVPDGILQDDESGDVSTDFQGAIFPTCADSAITTPNLCFNTVSGKAANGRRGPYRTVERSKNGAGYCVWFGDAQNPIVLANGGQQCLSAARIVKTRKNLIPANQDENTDLFAHNGLDQYHIDGQTNTNIMEAVNIDYVLLSVIVIASIVGLAAYCKFYGAKKNGHLGECEYTSYQSV